MEMRFLGNTGMKVSVLCFGTMTFGGAGYWKRIGDHGQKEADLLVGSAIDRGINFFDTADIYSGGVSEELLGKALGPRRKDIVLATKVRGRMGKGPNDVGLSRHHIIEACHASLRRLGSDYIDLYQVHNVDPFTSFEETLRALDDLIRDGKVRYIGCSNYAGWHLMKSLAISRSEHLERFITIQSYYSLLCRDIEYEVVPVCLDQNIGILPWSPLAGGFLTGKYRRGAPRPSSSRRSDPEGNFLQFDEEKGYDIVDELDRIAQAHGGTVAQTALQYLLRKPGVCSIVIGARTTGQLQDNLGALGWAMTDEEFLRLDAVTVPARVYPYWMNEFGKGDR